MKSNIRLRQQYTLYPVKRKDGKPIWYFRIYLPSGTRRAKSTGCTSKEKARYYVDNLLNNEAALRKVFSSDVYDYPSSSINVNNLITFADFAKGWWEWDSCPYVLARRSVGTEEHPRIKKSYVDNCKLWTNRYLIPYFGSINLIDITSSMINDFLSLLRTKHNLASKTINNVRSIFMIMLNEAKLQGFISLNPVSNTLSRTVDVKHQELITDSEWKALFNEEALKTIWNNKICYYAFSFVSGLTGLRAGELLALTFKDISPTAIIVEHSYSAKYGVGTTKTSEKRIVPITKDIYIILYLAYSSHPNEDNDFIFSHSGTKPMNTTRAREAFYKALKAIGIDEKERKRRNLTFHSWRHKFTTDCVKSDMHPEKIMALTGHKTLQMLTRYTDLSENDISKQINEIQKSKTENIFLSS